MVLAFLVGGMFQFLRICQKTAVVAHPKFKKIRSILYQSVVVYLLFKIGFKGGQSILLEPLDHVLFTSVIAVMSSILWTLLLFFILRTCFPFNRITQVSLATHFGSVSIGTFIAGVEFLSALGIEVSSNVVVWLAIMELPAIFVGVFTLKIQLFKMLDVLKKDTMLWILLGAIIFGMFGANIIPDEMNTFLFSTIFLPLLSYFLFEMGRKASEKLQEIKGQIKALLVFGIGIPILGGVLGSSLGIFLQYSLGEVFIFSILIASASYVLVPISLKEIMKNTPTITPKMTEEAIATSMAISVGITLPFNILVGFEIYYFYIKLLFPLFTATI
jgi:hypothetical protein